MRYRVVWFKGDLRARGGRLPAAHGRPHHCKDCAYNPRLGVVYHQLSRMSGEALTALKEQSSHTLTWLSEL